MQSRFSKSWSIPCYTEMYRPVRLQLHVACLPLLLLLSGSVQSIELTHQQMLTHALDSGSGSNGPAVEWGYNDTHIEVQLAYPSLGWIALGLSPNGGMDQSDVLFGYVNDTDGEVVVQDRYLTANMETFKVNLSLDTQQDWQMISGSKNGTHTILRAVRKQRTCDPLDRPFTDSMTPVIFSFNYKLPDSKTGPIRKHNFRGQTTLNFLQHADVPDPDITSEIVKTLEFRMDNRTVPGDAYTHYYCKLTTLPTFDKKYQSLASQPIINMANMKLIHHMLVYVCPDRLPEELGKKDFFECGPTSDSFVMKYCQSLIGGWAMGAKPTNYQPADVGQPYTPQMSGLQVVLQIHYNNPEKLTFVDDSGMRFLLTDKLRKYDSGIVMAGILSLDFTLTIPPGLDTFHVQGQCSDQCTAAMLPADGIKIYAATVHMHTRGKTGVARHFRGSQEILPPLGAEMSWDFNLQQSRTLVPFRRFLPGDRVIMECNFTTSNDSSPVYGGEGSMEEMCLVFLSYYPKAELSMCGSRFKINPYLKALGLNSSILMDEGVFPKVRDDVAEQMLNKEDKKSRDLLLASLKDPVTKFIESKKWDAGNTVNLDEFYSSMTYLGICAGQSGNRTVVSDDQPPQVSYYVDPIKQGC